MSLINKQNKLQHRSIMPFGDVCRKSFEVCVVLCVWKSRFQRLQVSSVSGRRYENFRYSYKAAEDEDAASQDAPDAHEKWDDELQKVRQ